MPLNCVIPDPPTSGIDHIGNTQSPRTGNTEDHCFYRPRLDWNDFNTCDITIGQDQWDGFAMYNADHYSWSALNAEKEDRWRYLANDWNPFNAAFDKFQQQSNW
jgi:hypothetical protein